MERKRERILWVTAVAFLGLTLATVLLAPVARAQGANRKSNQDYLRDLETALYILQNNYVDEIDSEELFRGAMEGLFTSLNDPYSLYLDDKFLEQLTDTTEGKYGGVGLYISKDRYDPEKPFGRLPYVKVVSPIENTPGWRAGLNAGDYIYAINGESAEGFSTQDVSNRLRGTPGSSVTITILRDSSFTFDVTLKRAEVEIPTVKSTVIANRIGYLRIIEFTPYSAPRVKESLQEFNAMGLKKLIIDVRSNPGGLLDSVVDVADLFFSGGVVVNTQYRHQRQNQVHRARPGKLVPSDVKIVVLIDKGSASASEILTGALKDRGRATIIGETTYGKGSIQQILPLNDAAIKLTTGRYYTPDGTSIDKTGIGPDIQVTEPELTEEQADAYATLLQENRISAFVDDYPKPKKSQVDKFIRQLKNEKVYPGERILRLMVKRESERRLNSPPVVDLEYDSVLLKAIDYLNKGG